MPRIRIAILPTGEWSEITELSRLRIYDFIVDDDTDPTGTAFINAAHIGPFPTDVPCLPVAVIGPNTVIGAVEPLHDADGNLIPGSLFSRAVAREDTRDHVQEMLGRVKDRLLGSGMGGIGIEVANAIDDVLRDQDR